MTEPTYPEAAPPPYPAGPEMPPRYPTAPRYPASAPAAGIPAQQSAPPQVVTGCAPPPTALDPTTDIDPHTGRIHLARRQRGADATTIGQLVLQLPHLLCSLMLLGMLAVLCLPPTAGLLLVLLWIASGALVFHRPTERLLARYLFRLRTPLRSELDRLEPVWHQVTAKAGVDARTYDLWIEEGRSVNATAAAGHIVAVTRYALEALPPAQLAGVLAHELGHHRGGHSWAVLLGYWYSLPARAGWVVFRVVAATLFRVASVISAYGGLVVALAAGALALSVALAFPPLLAVLVTPYLIAAVGRRAELRADRQAAELGFAEAMIEVFYGFMKDEEEALALEERKAGGRPVRPSLGERLLSSHPDIHTRIRRLEDWRDAAATADR
ncbi:hypothetical protein GCM10009639_57250 [Kitasatospora putterlickiae]|uniref:Peptidase M48 domain-containing protein n=1 Tax=Kitasatospora putterlickiae TaxID=221725 RepID=A0ABP4J7D4_9ACTN